MYSIMFNEVLPAPPPPPPPPQPVRDESEGPRFPVYLLPSLSMPFRRRRQSLHSSLGSPQSDTAPSLSSSPTDSTPSSPTRSPSTPSFSLPTNFLANLKPKGHHTKPSTASVGTSVLAKTHPNTIRCSACSADFAFSSQIVSKGFTGRYGRAFLVSPPEKKSRKGNKAGNLTNIRIGKSETRLLVTGSHVVADITCAICHAKIGWKYIDAKEESQKYKIGKYILETQRVVVYRSWEDVGVDDVPELDVDGKDLQAEGDEEPIVFDSDDEDECEDIFMGTWDPDVAAKRRSRRVNRRPKKSDD